MNEKFKFNQEKYAPRNVYTLRILQALFDLSALMIAFAAAYLLRFDFDLNGFYVEGAFLQMAVVVPMQFAALRLCKVHKFIWRYVSLREMNRILLALFYPAILLLLLRLAQPEIMATFIVPLSIVILSYCLASIGILGLRLLRREIYDNFHKSETTVDTKTVKPRVILVGAGRAGVMTLAEAKRRGDIGFEVIGFVDDDELKTGAIINGVKVLGTTEDLGQLVDELRVDFVIISIAQATRSEFKRILSICEEISIKVKTIPGLFELLQDKVSVSRIRDIEIEDLLGRFPVRLEGDELGTLLRSKTVMITGAGGSIGSELVSQLAQLNAKKLVLVERSESSLFEIEQKIRASLPDVHVVPILRDICDSKCMANVFRHYEPDIVFHAAAHKHVPLVETNAPEALSNNVLGSYIVANLAGKSGCESFVLVSTDKAVNPTSVMGATKRVVELIIQELNDRYTTKYVAVRFGNVIGSAGSVIPTFRKQIRSGGPVTVTHPDMVRYFMTIPEATHLILQAEALGQGGEIFILDMGEPVKILDLAKETIKLSGLKPDEDIEINFVGLRPGEKLFEELHTEKEIPQRTSHPKILVSDMSGAGNFDIDKLIKEIELLASTEDNDYIRTYLSRLIPEAKLNGDARGSSVEASPSIAPAHKPLTV